MNHKVLLADDSLTIQKVIKITLANQPYDITDCSSEEELFKTLPILKPKIVFLDFNLSETHTGYELSSKIKSICPSTKVLLLLGTFDTVDDESLEKCGASDKIVKPFDSNKFIAICKQLSKAESNVEPEEIKQTVNLPSSEDLDFPEPIQVDSEEQWQMSSSALQSESHQHSDGTDTKTNLPPVNALTKEISDWGMSVPGVISDSNLLDTSLDLPPVINEEKKVNIETSGALKVTTNPDTKFPDNSDLDYPDFGSVSNSINLDSPIKEAPKSKPQLISIDAFNDIPLEIEIQGNYVEDVADVTSIEAQIRDEVEENLWHVDEFENIKMEVSSKIDQMKNELPALKKDTFDEEQFRPLDEGQTIKFASESSNSNVDMTHLKSEIEELVKKHVKEYMDKMFQQNVEKISWEIIPDLAENLIRQELSKISSKVIND